MRVNLALSIVTLRVKKKRLWSWPLRVCSLLADSTAGHICAPCVRWSTFVSRLSSVDSSRDSPEDSPHPVFGMIALRAPISFDRTGTLEHVSSLRIRAHTWNQETDQPSAKSQDLGELMCSWTSVNHSPSRPLLKSGLASKPLTECRGDLDSRRGPWCSWPNMRMDTTRNNSSATRWVARSLHPRTYQPGSGTSKAQHVENLPERIHQLESAALSCHVHLDVESISSKISWKVNPSTRQSKRLHKTGSL